MQPNRITRHLAKALVAGALFCAAVCTSSYAADIQETSNKPCAFRLDGSIIRGDFEKLSTLVRRRLPFDEYDSRTSTICLRSAGGSYDEALKISELVFNRAMSTVIESEAECFSSCAIIFMAGVMTGQIAPSRQLSAGGLLGFHAPYVDVPDQKYSKEELEIVAQGMTKAILALVRLSSKEMKMGGDFIKKSLIQRILEKGKDDAFFIKTVFDAARWNIDVYDAEQHFAIDVGKVRAAINMCNNFHYSNMDQVIPTTGVNPSVQVEAFASRFHAKDFRILVRNNKTKDVICELYPKEDKAKKVTFSGCSYDYWSSNAFGDCREYKTRPTILIGKYVPIYFALDPDTLLKRFRD